MSQLFRISVLLFVVTFMVHAFAEFPLAEPDRIRERQNLLDLAANLPQSELVIDYEGTSHPDLFLDYFKVKIWPRLLELKKQENLYEIWMVAMDRALYHDIAERDQWARFQAEAKGKIDAIMSDPAWEVDAKAFAFLSNGLSGPLVDFARKLSAQLDVESYPPAAIPLLKELSEVMGQVRVIKNSSPLASGLAKAEQTRLATVSAFFKGEIKFDEAWKTLEGLAASERPAMGQDIALRASALLNRAAILRTQIAKVSGYGNWAEMTLARQAFHYAPGSRTPAERIQFLRGLLEATKAPYLEYLKKAMSVIKSDEGALTMDRLRPSQMGLLGNETATLIKEYYPLKTLESVWRETMIKAGMSADMLAVLNLDVYPREHKQTHAYMANLSSHKPHEVRIDGRTLEIKASADWYPARIFIVQNFRVDGPTYLKTAFHEGGHGVDYMSRRTPIPTQEQIESSNSWSEVHSMTLERFLVDRDFLVATGRTADGTAMTEELADQYIANARAVTLLRFRDLVSSALYDLEIWNVAYEDGGLQFMDHAPAVRASIDHETSQVSSHILSGVDPKYTGFSTDHFYGGEVRYIGYVHAEMAAQLTAEKLWDDFARTTGRRSLYDQPTLLQILERAYYRTGHSEPFPQAVERFIGKPLSPDAVVAGMSSAVESFVPQAVALCAKLLNEKNEE